MLQLTVMHNHYHIIEPFTFLLTRAMYAFMHFILVILLIYAHLCKDTRYSWIRLITPPQKQNYDYFLSFILKILKNQILPKIIKTHL